MREEEGPGQSSADSPATKAKGGLLVRRRVAVARPPLWAGATRRGAGRAESIGGQHRPLGKAPLPESGRLKTPVLVAARCPLPGSQVPSQLPMNRLPGGGWKHVCVSHPPRGVLFSWPQVIIQVLSPPISLKAAALAQPTPISLSLFSAVPHGLWDLRSRSGFESAAPAVETHCLNPLKIPTPSLSEMLPQPQIFHPLEQSPPTSPLPLILSRGWKSSIKGRWASPPTPPAAGSLGSLSISPLPSSPVPGRATFHRLSPHHLQLPPTASQSPRWLTNLPRTPRRPIHAGVSPTLPRQNTPMCLRILPRWLNPHPTPGRQVLLLSP